MTTAPAAPLPAAPRAPLTAHRRVCVVHLRADARAHERATHQGIAERLARLLGCRFDGVLDADAPGGAPAYLVPDETVVSLAQARRLGIRGEDDLFGGVVPAPFVATKAITHGLVDAAAAAPAGWCPAFAERVQAVVLPGHSAFALDDARRAARRLLADGPVRVKLAGGVGGSDQWIADDAATFEAGLAALDAARVAADGIVVEREVREARTYSVGVVHAGALWASYVGTQRTTSARSGHAVYGGSSLAVVRGGLDALEAWARAGADPDARHAVALARTYHEAALACFTGMFASRSNYDVVQGRDAAGRPLAGVLEQSWRIGGASGAEVLALQALRDDPARQVVRTRTVEVHGPLADPPPGATVFYAGVDPQVGPITKYAQEDDGDADA